MYSPSIAEYALSAESVSERQRGPVRLSMPVYEAVMGRRFQAVFAGLVALSVALQHAGAPSVILLFLPGVLVAELVRARLRGEQRGMGNPRVVWVVQYADPYFVVRAAESGHDRYGVTYAWLGQQRVILAVRPEGANGFFAPVCWQVYRRRFFREPQWRALRRWLVSLPSQRSSQNSV